MLIISLASPAEDSKTLTPLGRDMREVISTVYELADLGVTVIPIKS